MSPTILFIWIASARKGADIIFLGGGNMEDKDIKQVLAVNYLLSLGHKGTSGLECWIHEEHAQTIVYTDDIKY